MRTQICKHSSATAQRCITRRSTKTVTQSHLSTEAASSRREVLLGITASSWLLQELAASAVTYKGSQCAEAATGEEADDCRRAGLLADATSQENYSSVSNKKIATSPSGTAVATLDTAYAKSTLELMDNIQAYTSMDVYEKSRVAFIKQLKQDGLTWVSQYARGGSARSQSARSMYIAIDAVLGHLASNGLAPLPGKKAQTVLAKMEQAKAFLEEGR